MNCRGHGYWSSFGVSCAVQFCARREWDKTLCIAQRMLFPVQCRFRLPTLHRSVPKINLDPCGSEWSECCILSVWKTADACQCADACLAGWYCAECVPCQSATQVVGGCWRWKVWRVFLVKVRPTVPCQSTNRLRLLKALPTKSTPVYNLRVRNPVLLPCIIQPVNLWSLPWALFFSKWALKI
jgi:hypothetical protein